MGADTQILEAGTIVLCTRIPADGMVSGLEYGAFVPDGYKDNRYYVRPVGHARWGVARVSRATSEYGTDEEIVAAICAELDAAIGDDE